MPQKLQRCVVRILDTAGTTCGTGFFIAPGVAVTCAHVVATALGLKDDQINEAPGKEIKVRGRGSRNIYTAKVSADGWSPTDQGDVAFLRFSKTETPEKIQPVRLAYACKSDGHPYASFGFPSQNGEAIESWDRNIIDGIVETKNGYTRLQLVGNQMRPGFSGAPILDEKWDRVVGMVTWGRDGPHERVALAVTAETIGDLWVGLEIDDPDLLPAQKPGIDRLLVGLFNRKPEHISCTILIILVVSIAIFASVFYALFGQTIFHPPLIPVPTITPGTISIATLTVTPSPVTVTPITPESTRTKTLIPPTFTATPITACSFTGATNFETISNLIEAEASASISKDKAVIHAIFDKTATFYDYAVQPGEQPKFWPNPSSRYDNDLFNHTNLRNARHYDIQQVGPTSEPGIAYFVSGSAGEYQSGSQWPTFQNGGKRTPPATKYGSDHWTLKRNNSGCWVIIRFEFNAGFVPFPKP